MNNRMHNFPRDFKGEGQLIRFIDFPSFALLLLGSIVWLVLFKTVGAILPIVANTVGFLLTAFLYLVYTVKIPGEYYNKMGNERVYKLLYATFMHKRKKYIYVKDNNTKQ